MVVSPPCISEADRYSLEALQSIHQMMDDDKDGGIEVEESVEVTMFSHPSGNNFVSSPSCKRIKINDNRCFG